MVRGSSSSVSSSDRLSTKVAHVLVALTARALLASPRPCNGRASSGSVPSPGAGHCCSYLCGAYFGAFRATLPVLNWRGDSAGGEASPLEGAAAAADSGATAGHAASWAELGKQIRGCNSRSIRSCRSASRSNSPSSSSTSIHSSSCSSRSNRS